MINLNMVEFTTDDTVGAKTWLRLAIYGKEPEEQYSKGVGVTPYH